MIDRTPEQQAAVDAATIRTRITPVRTPLMQSSIDSASGRLDVPVIPDVPSIEPEPSSQLLRTTAQGLTLGWGDEIEAGVRAVLPESLGGGQYDQIRDGLRVKLREYKEANPKTAITAEIAGALIPSIAAIVFSRGKAAEPVVANLARIAATEGAIAGAGVSENSPTENPLGLTVDTGLGAAIGFAAPFGLQGAGNVIGKPVLEFFDKVREKWGTKASDIVATKVREIADQVGKSYSQVVEELMDGRLMTDNQTLLAVLKGLRLNSGKLGQQVQEKVNKRAKETASDALGSLTATLAPNNLGKTVYAGVEDAAKLEGDKLSKVFDGIFDDIGADLIVTPTIMDDVTAAVKGLPEIADNLNSLYGVEKLVPLFKRTADDVIELVRKPTMRDVEKVRRAISEQKNKLWDKGEADTAKALGELEKRLRSSIDGASPILKETRAAWSDKLKKAEIFDVGSTALNKNVDKVQMLVDKIRNNPEHLSMFREGLMVALRNKIRIAKTNFANLAKEDSQLNDLLHVAFEGEDITQLIKKLDLAGEVNVLSSKLPVASGSITTPLAQQSGGLLSPAISAVAGNPIPAVARVTEALMGTPITKGLSPSDTQKVIDIIFSNSPEVVSNALNSRQSLDIFNQYFTKVAGDIRRSTTQQAVQVEEAVITGREVPQDGLLNLLYQ